MIFHALPESNPFFANALSRPRVLCYPTVRPTRSALESVSESPGVEAVASRLFWGFLALEMTVGGVRLGKNNLEEPQQKATRVEMLVAKQRSTAKRAPPVFKLPQTQAGNADGGRKWFTPEEAGEQTLMMPMIPINPTEKPSRVFIEWPRLLKRKIQEADR